MNKMLTHEAGTPLPLGAHFVDGGTNFAVFSRHATRVWLLLFDDTHDTTPLATVELDPALYRSGDVWHIWVKGAGPGWAYAFRADGPYLPQQGQRFSPHMLLLDPYAGALCGTQHWDFAHARAYDPADPARDLPISTVDNSAWMAKCLLTGEAFDWQGVRPPKHPWPDTVIYETHVRGLSIDPSAAATHPGTYLAVIEKIPYFRQLGISAVELMPVQEFNPHELTTTDPQSGERLRNYWGYSTVAFFAPREGYGTRRAPGCQVSEFKTMVRELHRTGIEVILDVVFNHTAEGNELGPTLNFRGLDNAIYYLLDADRRHYKNYSGCGNTLNCNHPIVRDYILDCLRHWVVEMHVDGFRFDLASVMERDENGKLLANPPLLERIAEDPILHDVKLIAEAWDAAGVYQVGRFPGQRWSEWNGRYRDDVRRFWRGDAGMIGPFASRLCGSADLYQQSGKAPLNSINFVTCHDGFTLNDLVSFAYKHNEANGEGNRDGSDANFSANYGVEGPGDDPAIHALRLRQMKNFIATLFLSRGVPMLLGGDEFGRTQRGNNNAYCQDNPLSWYDWRLLEHNAELFRFVRGMIALRRSHPVLSRERFYTEQEVLWFDSQGRYPRWDAPSHSLGCRILAAGNTPQTANYALCLLFNAGDQGLSFPLPTLPEGQRHWRLAVDTARPAPHDICDTSPGDGGGPPQPYPLAAHCLAVLVSA